MQMRSAQRTVLALETRIDSLVLASLTVEVSI
ncbi:hypothetical protein HALDL1_05120 [Halobacterium sp. DL1]|nr:hypothetical protein HALDL1_05120 [Halobacterium sp. DL1]